jgi:hypothetical protein
MLSCSTPLTCTTNANHKNNMHELCLCYPSTKNEIQIAYTCLLAVARHASLLSGLEEGLVHHVIKKWVPKKIFQKMFFLKGCDLVQLHFA